MENAGSNPVEVLAPYRLVAQDIQISPSRSSISRTPTIGWEATGENPVRMVIPFAFGRTSTEERATVAEWSKAATS